MSANLPKAYLFQTAEQWGACLLDRLSAPGSGGLTPQITLGLHAIATDVGGRRSGVAVDPYQRPLWRTSTGATPANLAWRDDLGTLMGPLEVDAPLAGSPRLVLDRTWLWGFSPRHIRRYEAETLDLDRTFDLAGFADPEHPEATDPVAILDIASDGREGLWALVSTRDGAAALVHFNRRGCVGARLALPCEVGPAIQLASVACGEGMLLLSLKGDRLWRIKTSDGSCVWTLALDDIEPCWTATRLASDARARVGLGGFSTRGAQPRWVFALVDGAGDRLQEPLGDLFAEQTAAAAPQVLDFALAHDVVYFATDQGLFRLDASEACAAAGSVGVLLTPALHSPITSNGRGWLRAELDLHLPQGAALEVTFLSTDDPNVAERARVGAVAGNKPAATRQRMVWSALEWEATAGPLFVISGEGEPDAPIAIPLFTTTDRWLWLRLELQVPAGVEAPRLGAMRVLYPEISIVQQLPAIFQGADNDPGGALRRLVGVLETTTQQIDGSIRDAAIQLDPSRAGGPWLDHLAGALGLPWHRALPEGAKRRLLEAAGDLLAERGRRAGLKRLLECIVRPGQVSLVDLTADYLPLRVGGAAMRGGVLPALLSGVARSLPVLGGKARLGGARLACATTRCDPLEAIIPTLRIELDTTAEIKRAVAPLLNTILADYVPAGLRTQIRWRVLPAALLGGADELVLDGAGHRAIGSDAKLGRTVLAGRPAGIGGLGVGMGFGLR